MLFSEKTLRILLKITAAALLLALGLVWLIGPYLIELVYEGKSIEFLEHLMEGRATNPLEYYFAKFDRTMWAVATIIIALSAALVVVSWTLGQAIPSSLQSRFANGRLALTGGAFLVAAIVLLPLLPVSDLSVSGATRDQGVFLYMAQQILDGSVPYRDVWDHKPPIIYYINALGLFVSNGTRWGVWTIELMFLSAAIMLGFRIFRAEHRLIPAFLATTLWLKAFVALGIPGGNYTEEYALLMQFLALYFFIESEHKGSYSWRALLIGVIGSLCFLLRPNLIGIFAAVTLVFLWLRVRDRNWSLLVGGTLGIAVGFIGFLVLVMGYFWSQGALDDLIDQVFIYNFNYVTVTGAARWSAFQSGLNLVTEAGIGWTGTAGWVLGCCLLVLRKIPATSFKPLFYLALLAVPIEWFLACMSGRSYSHYFIAWLPILAFWTAFLSSVLINAVEAVWQGRGRKVMSAALLGVGSMVAVGMAVNALISFNRVRHESPALILEYAKSKTAHDDYVLVWGAEAAVNFVTHRKSPTRFVYQYPLLHTGYVTEDKIQLFLDEIKVNRPRLIIDTSSTNKIVPPLDPARGDRWTKPVAERSAELAGPGSSYYLASGMQNVFDFIADNYQRIDTVQVKRRYNWDVYALNP